MVLKATVKLHSWVRQALTTLNIQQSSNIIYQNDSKSIEWAENGPARHHFRVEGIDICHHFMMEMIPKKDIFVKRYWTGHMLPNIFAKEIAASDHHSTLKRLNIFKLFTTRAKTKQTLPKITIMTDQYAWLVTQEVARMNKRKEAE